VNPLFFHAQQISVEPELLAYSSLQYVLLGLLLFSELFMLSQRHSRGKQS
jgi:hypothetical protein